MKTSFHHGLRLTLPTGGTRLLCACQWQDDPLYVIEGRTLKKFATARDSVPEKTEELPPGTVVRLWDEENGNPQLGIL
jgi:hypothetical protein